jgi:hypothetical protein
MDNLHKNLINKQAFKTLQVFYISLLCFMITNAAIAQKGFDEVKRDKSYKKGTNVEYYKNGRIKSISEYKRKVFWYYTDTYWTIKEYDMEGNQVRLIKKVTQMARRENAEVVIKEEVYNYEPKKENQSKETIRPE